MLIKVLCICFRPVFRVLMTRCSLFIKVGNSLMFPLPALTTVVTTVYHRDL